MTQIITINPTDADHLATVMADMRRLGAPTIRCTRDEVHGLVVALEGSHRLAAAIALGLEPNLVMLDDDDMITCADIGFDDCGWFEGEAARVADIRERIAGDGSYRGCPIVTLED